MADRLAELLRQRALLQEHLAWLDREIATASGAGSAPALGAPAIPAATELPAPAVPRYATPPVTAPRPPTVVAPPPVTASTSNTGVADPDVILEQYRVAPAALKTDIRKGCLLYFVGALVFVGLVVAGLYLAFRK